MGKLFYIMGKSSSGKDTIFKSLMQDKEFSFRPLILYTTRPIREGETDGVEYYFTDDAQLEQIRTQGRLIELRSYQTVHGVWNYFTADDGQLSAEDTDYLAIGTLESYQAMRNYYGKEKVIPVLITLEDGERLQRALDRERQQEEPRYEEMCRRFLADAKDFSKENIKKAGITESFENTELFACLDRIREYIRKNR